MAEKNESQDKINESSSEEDVEMESDESEESSDDDASDSLIEELQQKVTDEPFVYEHRCALITALRKAGELNKLRSARTEMQEIFPLTPGVKVWLEFVQFAIGDMTRKGLQYPRDIFERALTSVGLHVTEGPIIWQAYREYETAVLAGLQPAGSIPTPDMQEKINAQTKKIINLLKRQLTLPHQGIESTFEEYQEFCEEIDPNVEKTFEKSKEKLKILTPFEDALKKAKPPRTEAYKSYIKHELKGGDPSRIQCIFERALMENSLAPEFWIKYGKYLDLELRSRSAILKMYKRAVKNCPWSLDLYLLHMRALERFQYQSHDLIKGKFEKQLLSSNFSSGTDFLKVWTAYIDYMRRRVDWEKDDQDAKIEDLRNTFENAVEFMMTNFGREADPTCTILQYRARIEAKFCKSMDKARECWNHIMQQGFGNQYQMWLEYFNLERSYGDHKHCRKILQRALNSVTDWPEYIVEMYLNFEREEGTLEQYEQAVERCDAQMARIEERRAKERETEALKQKEAEDIAKWCKMSTQKKRKKTCDLCHVKGHERLTYGCEALQDPPLENVTPFKGKLDVLSNFYPCKLRFEGKEYASTEHLYQYYKAVESGRDDIAKEILSLKETRDVKILSFKIKTDEKWFERKCPLFDRILAAKLLYCPEYARALLHSKEILAEAVPGDTYWSTGMSKEDIIYTKMEYWPGQNVMGKMHMKLREIVKTKLKESDNDGSSTSVARLSDLCQKVAEKEVRLQEEESQKKVRGYQKQKEDRDLQQKVHQKQKEAVKKQKIQAVTHSSLPGKTDRQETGFKAASSKTDQDGFKIPPPPGFKPSTDQTSGQKVVPPPGYKRHVQDGDDSQPPEKKQKVAEVDSVKQESSQPGEQAVEKCKVFVSNLRYETKESDLTPLFIQYGELKDIRLVKQAGGKTRGFGYVEYKDEAPAKAALALDRHEIDGRPMFVSECKPNRGDRGAFKFSTRMEKCKLFVRNLPLTTTKEALEQLFSQYGTVKETRMVTHKSGAPKGLAYVEYFHEESASKAVMQADGLKMGQQEIAVAISNPPSRKPPLTQREQSSFQPSLGGGKKEADRGGRAKTMLAFQPRSIQNKPKIPVKPGTGSITESDGQKSSNNTEGKKSGLSNADFRSMLLKSE